MDKHVDKLYKNKKCIIIYKNYKQYVYKVINNINNNINIVYNLIIIFYTISYAHFYPQLVNKFNMLIIFMNIINKYIYNIRIYAKLQ